MATMNCYEILGLHGGATSTDVKKAYRKLATQYHPDKVNQLPPKLKDFADEEMRRINKAKEVLLDPGMRAEHDHELKAPRQSDNTRSQAPGPNDAMKNVPYTFACPHCSTKVSAIPIDRPYVLSCPRCRRQMSIPKAPSRNGDNENVDKLTIYLEALKRAMLDSVITSDESYILDGLRESLKISPMEHQNMLFRLQNKMR